MNNMILLFLIVHQQIIILLKMLYLFQTIIWFQRIMDDLGSTR